MKFSLLLCAFFNLVIMQTAFAQQEEVLTNASIIELQGLNLGDAVVIEKIKTTKCQFDTSISALKSLQEAKLSPAVIQAMIATKSAVAAAPAVVATPAAMATSAGIVDSDDPMAPHASGVWVSQEINGKRRLTQLESESSVETTSGGFIGPYGAGKIAQTARLNGVRADLQLSETHPVFYFYLGRAGGDGNLRRDYEFDAARGPKDFTLAQFKIIAKDKCRALEVGRQGGYGGSSGIAHDALREFTSEKMAEGIYKVMPREDLTVGEYCFCRANTRGNGDFFPFGIGLSSASGSSQISWLAGTLKSDKPQDVVQALKALQEINAVETVPQIIPLLTNSDMDVICQSCRTLAFLGDKDVIHSIEPLLKGSPNLKKNGPSLSIAASIHRGKEETAIKKEAQDAIDKLKAK